MTPGSVGRRLAPLVEPEEAGAHTCASGSRLWESSIPQADTKGFK
jgi:hypothetical protein